MAKVQASAIKNAITPVTNLKIWKIKRERPPLITRKQNYLYRKGEIWTEQSKPVTIFFSQVKIREIHWIVRGLTLRKPEEHSLAAWR